jgi:hypothetical protein
MLSNEYIGLYFYSAIFQGNMALLALLAVFVVFKRQELSSELQSKESALISFVQNSLDGSQVPGRPYPLSFANVTELKSIVKELSDEKYSSNISAVARGLLIEPAFTKRFTERDSIINKRAQLFSAMNPAFNWILSTIIVSLVLLPFAHFIHYKLSSFELFFILCVIVLNTGALLVIKIYIAKALQD